MSEYARYFKQQLLSDCDLVISWPIQPLSKNDSPCDEERSMDCCTEEDQPSSDQEQHEDAELPRGSCSFPAHQLLLFKSSHFEAQGLRWQQPSVTDIQATQQAASNQHESSATAAGHLRTEFVLSIDHEEQLSAAEAVIAALYSIGDCLSSLPHNQLVHALVIADRIDLPGVTEQIIAALKTAAITPAGLSSTALETMAKLSAWPDCMYQTMVPILRHFIHDKHMVTGVTELKVVLAADTNESIRNVMLAAFGDLQAVWQNPALSQLLMKLPLPAIQLLLSSDKLQVPSEDIVLYTVEQYGKNQPSTPDSMAALSSLVRAPYLSEFALQFVALSGSCSVGSKKQLNQLFTLRRVIGSQPPTSELQVLSGAPQSWLQGPRSLVNQEPVSVIWKLPVQQLADACKRAAALNYTQVLRGPDSPPLGGLSWTLDMQCYKQDDGIMVGVYAGCSKKVNEMFHKFHCHINYNNTQREVETGCLVLGGFRGSSDFFKIGAMAGGWDAAAWAAKGLPTSGDLVLEFKMLKVW